MPELRAILLATSIDLPDAEALWAEGVEVHALNKRFPRLKHVAAAALELRRQHPHLPLLVSASERLLRRLERSYPSLIDIACPVTSPSAILAVLNR